MRLNSRERAEQLEAEVAQWKPIIERIHAYAEQRDPSCTDGFWQVGTLLITPRYGGRFELSFPEVLQCGAEAVYGVLYRWEDGQMTNIELVIYGAEGTSLGEFLDTPEVLEAVKSHLKDTFVEGFMSVDGRRLEAVQDWVNETLWKKFLHQLIMIGIVQNQFDIEGYGHQLKVPLDIEIDIDSIASRFLPEMRELLNEVNGREPVIEAIGDANQIVSMEIKGKTLILTSEPIPFKKTLPEGVTLRSSAPEAFETFAQNKGAAWTLRGFGGTSSHRVNKDGFVIDKEGNFGAWMDGVSSDDGSEKVVAQIGALFGANSQLMTSVLYRKMIELLNEDGQLFGGTTLSAFRVLEANEKSTLVEVFGIGDSPLWAADEGGNLLHTSRLHHRMGRKIDEGKWAQDWNGWRNRVGLPVGIPPWVAQDLLSTYHIDGKDIYAMERRLNPGALRKIRPNLAQVRIPKGGYLFGKTDGVLATPYEMLLAAQEKGPVGAAMYLLEQHKLRGGNVFAAQLVAGKIGKSTIKVPLAPLKANSRRVDDATVMIRQF